MTRPKDQSWFQDPALQERIAKDEKDFAEGRLITPKAFPARHHIEAR